MDYIDYYGVLGVPRTATAEEIAKTYRKLARKYHPDRNKQAGAEEQFKRISEAYEVLKDPERRAKFDEYGAAWQAAQQARPQGAAGGAGQYRFGFAPEDGDFAAAFEDIGDSGFSRFFEHLFGASGPRRGEPGADPFAGVAFGAGSADHEATLSLGLEEALAGGRRQIRLQDPATGLTRAYNVSIPPHARDGQRIRLAGQGGTASRGGRAGDLYLTISIRPHPRYRTEGSDLHTRLEVMPWVAALGGVATLATPEGQVKLKVPAGSPSGRRLRLRGRGLARGRGERGDLYAEIRIVVPEQLTSQQRALWEQLATLDRSRDGAA